MTDGIRFGRHPDEIVRLRGVVNPNAIPTCQIDIRFRDTLPPAIRHEAAD